MENALTILKETFEQYNGTGFYLCLYFVVLLYIYIACDKKEKEIFVYPFIVFVVLVCNPFSVDFIHEALGRVFWRVLWTLPIGVLIAYSAVRISGARGKAVKKGMAIAALIALIAVSGRWIFRPENYQKAENPYKLPKETIAVVDTIIEASDDTVYPMVVLPRELVVSARQYRSNLRMLYGRDYLLNENSEEYINANFEKAYVINALYNEGYWELDNDLFIGYLSDSGTRYVVIDRNLAKSSWVSSLGLQFVGSAYQFDVYRLV